MSQADYIQYVTEAAELAHKAGLLPEEPPLDPRLRREARFRLRDIVAHAEALLQLLAREDQATPQSDAHAQAIDRLDQEFEQGYGALKEYAARASQEKG